MILCSCSSWRWSNCCRVMRRRLPGRAFRRHGQARLPLGPGRWPWEPGNIALDEPTAGLDPDRANSFVRLIRLLVDELGLTVVFVTHDLDTWQHCRHASPCSPIKRILPSASIDEVANLDHPFIRNFFLSERGQRAMKGHPLTMGKSRPRPWPQVVRDGFFALRCRTGFLLVVRRHAHGDPRPGIW